MNRAEQNSDSSWPRWWKWCAQLLALFVIAIQLPTRSITLADGQIQKTGFLNNLCRPAHEHLGDFFQEWGSARNWQTGLPIYTHHRDSLPIHLDINTKNLQLYLEYNAHPPTSVLLTLPFGQLSYENAIYTWHAISFLCFLLAFGLFVNELKIPLSGWYYWLLPTCAFLLLFDPWRQQFSQGQLNGILLLLFIIAWKAIRQNNQLSQVHRSEQSSVRHERIAGVCLGIAATIKIFPAFLLLFLFLKKRYHGVFAGVLTIISLTALTMVILGWSTYRDYISMVLPALKEFRCSWVNHSLVGFWHRLFVGSESEAVIPFFHSRLLAWSLTIGSAFAIVGIVSRAVISSDINRGYWLFITTMLLLGPLTWSHSILLLIPSWCYLLKDWKYRLPPNSISHLLLTIPFMIYFFEQRSLMQSMIDKGWLGSPLTPASNIFVASTPFYILFVFWLLQIMALRKKT
jgi:hypothetical protein